jgi:lipopolysaccharide export LptBFGC system permease protein LptF
MTKEEIAMRRTADKARKQNQKKSRKAAPEDADYSGLWGLIKALYRGERVSVKQLFIPPHTKITYAIAVILCCFIAVSLATSWRETNKNLSVIIIIMAIIFLVYGFIRLKNNIKNGYFKILSTIFSVILVLLVFVFGSMIYYITL